MLKLWCLAILLSLFLQSDGKAPCSCGTVVRVKKEAIKYVSQSQQGPLQKAIGFIAIPDYSQKIQSGGGLLGGGLLGGGLLSVNPLASISSLVGGILKIAGIQILNVDLPQINVNLVPSIGLQVSVATSLHIKASILRITDVELQAGSSVLVDARISHSSKGFPIVSVTACKSLLGNIKITLGGHSLLPPIVNILQEHIRVILADKLCLTVSNVFIGMNAELGLLGSVTPVDDQINLQYVMPSQPVVTKDYMDIDMDAQYTVNDQLIELPVSEEHFTLPPDAGKSDSMVNMGFSQEYFQSMYTAMHSSGAFNLDITGQMLAGQLSTSVLGSYIPEVAKLYPQPLPMIIKFFITNSPKVTLQKDKVVMDASPSFEIIVVSDDSARKTIMVLGAELSLALQLDVSETKIKATASLNGALQLNLVSSTFSKCQCKASAVSGYILTIFEKVILTHINVELNHGISLPAMPNMKLVKPAMEVTEEYAVMSCDLDYKK